MTGAKSVVDDSDVDEAADVEIMRCLTLYSPKSFFLFAGAGSGKTRSLVKALDHVRGRFGDELRARGQRVGVITYTNAASDEIKRRIAFDPLIDVSTIHSFAWSLINGLNRDIREYLLLELAEDIKELEAKQAAGRKAVTAASTTRLNKIASKTKRLENLDQIKKFIYSPTGENRTRDSLSHAEVMGITASFLQNKKTMQAVLTGRYPFLLIDESQDTNKKLVEALFVVQAANSETFALGLLGDMMQRIYNDGKEGLGTALPSDWSTPKKQMNHRCPQRVVTLINKVRGATDGQVQKCRSDSIVGVVRLFILPADTADKLTAEASIATHMAKECGDESWQDLKTCKVLTLEHRMAARRLNFLEMFLPLYEVESWRTGLLSGDLPAIRFFSGEVLPLVQAKQRRDSFAVARLMKTNSPLMSAEALRASSDNRAQLKTALDAIDKLMALWDAGTAPNLLTVLRSIQSTGLLAIPESLQLALRADEVVVDEEVVEPEDRESKRLSAIKAFLEAPFSQVEPFTTYMSGNGHFDTHQGVKGLEFDRVMVIMDDSEARGFLFKYDNLFGGKSTGDPSIDGTRRLFYVTCSRAKQSLALVAYSSDPQRVKHFALTEGWFAEEEIVLSTQSFI